jgi:hypothetical protein
MKKHFLPGLFLLVVFFIETGVLANEPLTKKFSPVGTWEFKAPTAPEGYTAGDLIISKEGKEYSVVFAMSEYYKVTGYEVEYKKKNLSFILYIETETVHISGTFEEDKFTGTASYSEGVIEVYATREKEDE